MAPGTNIYTTTINNSYTSSFGGTSAACPHVAGIAALILSVNPDLTAKQVRDIIEQTAQKVRTDVYTYSNDGVHNNGLWNNEMGYGLVDAYAAVMKAKLDKECYQGEETLSQEITANKTLTTTHYAYGDIVIKSGKRLTVKSVLRMAPESRIIVEPGAELRVDKGSIVNACEGEYWQGIVVEGNSSDKAQSDNYQGQVYLSGATIKGARTAISTFGREDNDWNKTGGIVRAYNTTFKDNHRSVEFLSFAEDTTLDNKSSFTECTFTWTDSLPDAVNKGTSHITMWQVKGVNIMGCYFKDERSAANKPDRTHGILTNQAGFLVNRYTKEIMSTIAGKTKYEFVYNNFVNLTYGILAENSQGRECTIERSYFTNAFCGVYATFSNRLKVKNNYFSVIPQATAIDIDNDSIAAQSLGVAVYSSHHFEIENNEFTGASKTLCGVGVQVYNSGAFANTIKNNIYEKLYAGSQALGTNQGKRMQLSATGGIGFVDVGLEYRCNQFTNSSRGIHIVDKGAENNLGINKMQGSLLQPAYNSFTSVNNSIVNKSSTGIIYYYYGGKPNNSIGDVTLTSATSQGETCSTIGVTTDAVQEPGVIDIDTTIPINPSPLNMVESSSQSSQETIIEELSEEDLQDNALYDSYVLQYGNAYSIPNEVLMDLAEHSTQAGMKSKGMLYFKGIDMDYHPSVFIDTIEQQGGNSLAKNKKENVIRTEDKFIISPNPAGNHINIEYAFEQQDTYRLIIYDIQGKEVLTIVLQSNIGKQEIDISNLPCGTYTYQVVNNKAKTHIKYGKLIIQR